VLALLAYASRLTRANRRLHWLVAMIAVFAASLFYGDAVITPAISVLSAVEGLSVATPAFKSWVLPIAVAIIVWLFKIQKHGTGGLGRYFGAVTVVWFLVIAALGMASIAETPGVLGAVDPRHALGFAVESPDAAFLALGAVFLTLTGAEALYADMGHFGSGPIRIGWVGLVLRGRRRIPSSCLHRIIFCCRWSDWRPQRRSSPPRPPSAELFPLRNRRRGWAICRIFRRGTRRNRNGARSTFPRSTGRCW